ncbi:MAG: sugar kinase [Thermoanaerobaculia bacterium]|nr:sugar kinase [Thermoanaerobaculia bacterium]
MKKVVSFGEIMLRLSPPGFERFFQSPVLQATFGGGEANVAVSLAQFGLDSRYVTRVPANALGDAALRVLRAEGVHVDGVLRGGERLGIYFAETGASQRAGTVIYDRARSAIAEAKPGMFDWKRLLEGAEWFHVTGITPALGADVARVAREAIEAARAAGARVSIDLNYRRKLWTESQARSVMRSLAALSHVIIANEEDIQACLGIAIEGADVTSANLGIEAYRTTARRVAREFGVEIVAITLRESFSASRNGWSALLWDEAAGQCHEGPRFDVALVDRIGGGDSFAAGLIFGLVTGRGPEAALRFAVAASALKQTIPGDFNRVSVAEVDLLAGGDASGRVRR